jgi:hypothetical protein
LGDAGVCTGSWVGPVGGKPGCGLGASLRGGRVRAPGAPPAPHQVVLANPKTAGVARWIFLALWGHKMGRGDAAALDYVTKARRGAGRGGGGRHRPRMGRASGAPRRRGRSTIDPAAPLLTGRWPPRRPGV